MRYAQRAILAALVAALAGPVVGAAGPQGQEADDAIPGVERIDGLSAAHLPGTIPYDRVPPAGGPHAPVWVNCGVYTQPVPTEMAVHSLEHGAVWITYRPDLPPAAVLALRDLARGQTHVLVSPWAAVPPLPSPIVASAWGFQLSVEDASDPRLAAFVQRYVNGPLAPEPGAPCRGGAGTPLLQP